MHSDMIRYYDINTAGHSIRCKLYCNDVHKIGKVVIYGHGFGGHKDNKAAERFALRAISRFKKSAVLTFDLPCHGADGKKKLLLDDCLTYIALIIEDCKTRFGTEDVFAYATSFGGFLILKYLADRGNPFRKIALRCPAVDMYAVITHSIITPEAMEKLDKGKDVLVGFDRMVKVGSQFLDDLRAEDLRHHDFMEYADDILILHGTKDEIISFDDVAAFADDNVIEFVPVENADHRFSDPGGMDLAIAAILDFFAPAMS